MANGVRKHLKQFLVCLVFSGTALSLVGLPVVFAQSTKIEATICDPQGPLITLNTPVSDSVTNLPVIPVQGSAERTSQVDIYKNGQYDQSVSVAINNPQLSTTISLSEGTNTIRLEAFYSCNQTHAQHSVIVTYQSGAVGSPARPSTRTIPAGDTVPAQISNPDQSEAATPGIIDRIKDNLIVRDSYVKATSYWIAAFLAVLFSFAALLPASYLMRLLGLCGLKNKSFTIGLQIGIRTFAALVALIFATIIQA